MADIIEQIARRYKELEIMKKDQKENIAYLDGQQNGLLWVGYRIDEQRMIKAMSNRGNK